MTRFYKVVGVTKVSVKIVEIAKRMVGGEGPSERAGEACHKFG